MALFSLSKQVLKMNDEEENGVAANKQKYQHCHSQFGQQHQNSLTLVS
jgi:hypothetical protein